MTYYFYRVFQVLYSVSISSLFPFSQQNFKEFLFILFENQIQTTSTSPCRTQVQPSASFLVCSLIFIEYYCTIRNGIFNIIVGKLLYDKTGSSAAFGLTFMIEALIGILLQIFTGTAIDKLNPKWIMNLFGSIKDFSTFNKENKRLK